MNKKQFTHVGELLISHFTSTAPALLALGLFLAGSTRTSATLLYATSSNDNVIYSDDSLIPNSRVMYFTALKSPDCLMFDTLGNVIYTALSAGEVRSYNPNTAVDSLISSGLNGPADMALEPGGQTMLVSEYLCRQD